jgi:hypothetical protein
MAAIADAAEDLKTIRASMDEQRPDVQISDRIAGAMSELRESLAHDLGADLAKGMAAISDAAANRVAEDVGGRVENLREELIAEATRVGTEVVQRASESVGEEIRAMRKKIDSWGRSRTAAKVAEQLSAVDERLDEITRTVEEDLVEAVFDRMQRAFDRRFEVLVQLVETRMRDAVAKRDEPPSRRRRFRRQPEEDS